MLEILYKIGFAICHQIPERSFFVDGDQMPLCSRCSGIYIGMFLTILFYFFTKFIRGKKPILPPKTPVVISSIISILIIIFNAISPMLNIPTNNLLRFITGIFFGISIPIFLIMALNYSPKSNYDNERIISIKGYMFLLALSSGAVLLILKNIAWVNLSLSYISILGLLMFVLLVNGALVALIMENIKYFKLTPYYYSFLIASIFVGMELFMFSILHHEIIENLVK